jgi:hypothetical protein
MKEYSKEQIDGIFGHKASGVQTYLETSDSDLVANHETHVKDLLSKCRVLGKKDNPNDVSNTEIAELKTAVEKVISDYGQLKAAGHYREVKGKREEYNDNSADKSEKNSPAGW